MESNPYEAPKASIEPPSAPRPEPFGERLVPPPESPAGRAATNFGALGGLCVIVGMFGVFIAPEGFWLMALGVAFLVISIVARIVDRRPPA